MGKHPGAVNISSCEGPARWGHGVRFRAFRYSRCVDFSLRNETGALLARPFAFAARRP